MRRALTGRLPNPDLRARRKPDGTRGSYPDTSSEGTPETPEKLVLEMLESQDPGEELKRILPRLKLRERRALEIRYGLDELGDPAGEGHEFSPTYAGSAESLG